MGIGLFIQSCKIPDLVEKSADTSVPASFNDSQDTTNIAAMNWREYFTDPYLAALIDTALTNNQELNIMLAEIEISKNEVKARKGEYLPFVGIKGALGVEKVGRYTSQGANDATTNIEPGKEFPDPLPDFMLQAYASWEVDIWKKLRNAKKSAVMRYLASVEGRNFMKTHLVAEIANGYYELMALDNQLAIVQQNIGIQNNALNIVKLQKEAAKVTELAVNKFEAEMLKNRSLQYYLQQQIVETENRINFLVGRYPQPVERNSEAFSEMVPDSVYAGIPSQLMANRPDIKQAELEIAAAKLDVQVARANYYPAVRITAAIGDQAINPAYWAKMPESILFSLAGDAIAPLVNKRAIEAEYLSNNAKQTQAIYNYQRTVLGAFVEVANQLSNIRNLKTIYDLKEEQVATLNKSVTISTRLFQSARADYMEVLLTQRDALEAKMELIETKMKQMSSMVNIYQALGGGWK
ncbi:MAG: efflux transporter outer membrane subunit [Saprospiraceae bacterium]|nr:efflux transporter outer membrane subunit [Saprospiraceae bacterium]